MPREFARAIQPLLEPGTTLFVTDARMLSENTHSDITVLSQGGPEA
jgi:hypothetical protein